MDVMRYADLWLDIDCLQATEEIREYEYRRC